MREGVRHSIFLNPKTGLISTVPRHTEIDIFLVKWFFYHGINCESGFILL